MGDGSNAHANPRVAGRAHGATDFTLVTGGVWRAQCNGADGGRVQGNWEVHLDRLDAGELTYDACISEDGGWAAPGLHREGTRALTAAERTTLDVMLGNIRESTGHRCAST